MHPAIERLLESGRVEKGLWWEKALRLISGCVYVSAGCANCWSCTESHIRSHQENTAMRRQFGGVTTPEGKWNGNIVHLYENLDKIVTARNPYVWAVWNDLFHEKADVDIAFKLFRYAFLCPEQIFIIITKRPEIMKKRVDDIYFNLKRNYPEVASPLPNIILMVSAENQKLADARIPWLLQTKAAIRGVSLEPLLGGIDLTSIQDDRIDNHTVDALNKIVYPLGGHSHPIPYGLDWVVCGTESIGGKPGRIIEVKVKQRKEPTIINPQDEAIRDLKNQCVAAKIPFFLKQMPISGKLIKMPELDGRIWDQFPEVA